MYDAEVSITELYGFDHFQRYYFCGYCTETVFHLDLQKHLQSDNHFAWYKHFEKFRKN